MERSRQRGGILELYKRSTALVNQNFCCMREHTVKKDNIPLLQGADSSIGIATQHAGIDSQYLKLCMKMHGSKKIFFIGFRLNPYWTAGTCKSHSLIFHNFPSKS